MPKRFCFHSSIKALTALILVRALIQKQNYCHIIISSKCVHLPAGHTHEHKSVLCGQSREVRQLVGKLPQTSADDAAARIYSTQAASKHQSSTDYVLTPSVPSALGFKPHTNAPTRAMITAKVQITSNVLGVLAEQEVKMTLGVLKVPMIITIIIQINFKVP